MKILLVDDDRDFLRMAQLSLGSFAKWKVYMANCGTEAIVVAKNVNPDVIVLDVVMPGMDGITTLSELRRHDQLSSIPVIFISATMQAHEVEPYCQQGALGLISKPCDPRTLAAEIVRLMKARQ